MDGEAVIELEDDPVEERTESKAEAKIEASKDPIWKRDGHETEDAYKEHMVKLVEDLLEESTRAWRTTKERWMQSDNRLKRSGTLSVLTDAISPTKSDLPFVPQAIEEAIAMAVETVPRPQITARREEQQQFVGALNSFVEEELDANDFDLLVARVVMDMKRFSLGVIKQTVDPYQTGPFGQKGRIILSRVDPRYIWPDPLSPTFDKCRYIIEASPRDLSDIREMYPMHGYKVPAESTYSLTRRDNLSDDTISSPLSDNDSGWIVGERKRALVKELWLKDDRKEFVPEMDEDGEPLTDSEGSPVGRLEKIYPHGRYVVVANKVLLLDIANPFRHGQPPYSFFPGRVSPELLTYGDVEVLGQIEDKMNKLHKDMLKAALVNMNSPWIIDQHAFDSPRKFHNVTNDPGLVLPVRPGARVMRLPPAELPQYIFPLIDWLKGIFDDVLGIQSISRGQVEKGSQLSAEAIASLQGTATSRIRLKSRLFENSLKHLGHLLQWNIRQFYPAGLEVEMESPSQPGQKIKLRWNDDAAQADYAVGVQAGSSLPGAKQSSTQLSLTLWDHGLIGPLTALKMMEFPGADAAVQERQQMLLALAQANLDAAIKEATGHSNKTGAAGRKAKLAL